MRAQLGNAIVRLGNKIARLGNTIARAEKKRLSENDLLPYKQNTGYGRNKDIWWPFVYTYQVQYLAEYGNAYWLLRTIALWQYQNAVRDDERLNELQYWRLNVNENCSATLICERDKGDIVVTQEIPFTDFPLRQVDLCLSNVSRYWEHLRDHELPTINDYGVLLFPSEYKGE